MLKDKIEKKFDELVGEEKPITKGIARIDITHNEFRQQILNKLNKEL